MLTADFLKSHFDRGLPYSKYVATGKPAQQDAFRDIYDRAELTADQTELLSRFARDMKILVSSGVWCGDCVQQVPLLARIAEANPKRIDLRIVDRDEHKDLADRIMINQGHRVPAAIFMAEDFEFVSLLGDRTLTRYRAVAMRNLGPACPLPGAPVPDGELAATLEDWIDETERVHLILRLSTRLRQKHGD
ncbi:MAG: thioredoxin family protein [Phycisphaerales bacterium]